MFKKILLAAVVVIGLVYASGNDLGSIKRKVTNLSSENARSFTGGSNDNWGKNSRQ
ncbi:hypothetical protein [Qipengyuania marisflavi]|uniref:hypothetical protein n=1 Tax=Qipengyuania marisflavi TaxID=2486356 RepID=UPI0014868AAE|nr:hypothetical protein [Qipengyuania marisflavi]